jgi:hypothetical protein
VRDLKDENKLKLRLGSQPSGNVDLVLFEDALSTGTNGIMCNRQNLTFTRTNWNDYQEVNCVGSGMANTAAGNLNGLTLPVTVMERATRKVICNDVIPVQRQVAQSSCAVVSGDPHFTTMDKYVTEIVFVFHNKTLINHFNCLSDKKL